MIGGERFSESDWMILGNAKSLRQVVGVYRDRDGLFLIKMIVMIYEVRRDFDGSVGTETNDGTTEQRDKLRWGYRIRPTHESSPQNPDGMN
jgi:hypothetical protein